MPPKVAALAREVLEPRLHIAGVTAQDIRAMLRSDGWNALQSRNEQVVFLEEFIKTECGITITAAGLGQLFMIEASHVRKIRNKAKTKPKEAHRPLALSEEQELLVIQFIRDGLTSGNYVTQRDVLNFAEANFAKSLTYRWMAYFLQRHSDQVTKQVVVPQESLRIQVPRLFLDQYVKLIKEYVPLVPTELIFNIDECGFSDWEERKPKPVLIPRSAQGTSIHYPVNRSIRHQTLVCCITAAGDAYCPLLVTSDGSARQIFNHGPRDRIDLRVEIAASPYVTHEIFESYLDEVVIPAVESNRTLEGCNNKPAILFCDNCSAHCTEVILKKLARHGVLILTYPPHTSHLFQVLDVLLFGILKRAKKYQRRDDALSPQLDHILRLFRAYELATTSTNIRASWLKTGFQYEERADTRYLVVDEAAIRSSPAFREIWEFDYHLDRVSARRQSQQWGWINEHNFLKKEVRRFKQ